MDWAPILWPMAVWDILWGQRGMDGVYFPLSTVLLSRGALLFLYEMAFFLLLKLLILTVENGAANKMG